MMIALRGASSLKEPINRALLAMVEDGISAEIHDRWFD